MRCFEMRMVILWQGCEARCVYVLISSKWKHRLVHALGWAGKLTARRCINISNTPLTTPHAGPTQRNHSEDRNWIPNKALVSGPLWGALLKAAGRRQNGPRNQVTNSWVTSLGLPLWFRMAARFQAPRLYSMVGPL
jgi:hypothetical protein